MFHHEHNEDATRMRWLLPLPLHLFPGPNVHIWSDIFFAQVILNLIIRYHGLAVMSIFDDDHEQEDVGRERLHHVLL